jgi:hypothetical protein
MATPGFEQVTGTNSNADVEQKLRLEHALKGSASWFILVGALSLVNSVLGMAGAKIHFIFGLGIPQVVDAISHQAGSAGQVLDLVINGMIAGVFALFWHFAKKGAKWAGGSRAWSSTYWMVLFCCLLATIWDSLSTPMSSIACTRASSWFRSTSD